MEAKLIAALQMGRLWAALPEEYQKEIALMDGDLAARVLRNYENAKAQGSVTPGEMVNIVEVSKQNHSLDKVKPLLIHRQADADEETGDGDGEQEDTEKDSGISVPPTHPGQPHPLSRIGKPVKRPGKPGFKFPKINLGSMFASIFKRGQKEPDESGKHMEHERKPSSGKASEAVKWAILAVILLVAGAVLLYGRTLVQQIPSVQTAITIAKPAPIWSFANDAVRFDIRHAPKTLGEVLDNWIGWVIVIFMLWLLTTTFKDEAADRKEPKDHTAVMRGFIVFLVIFFLTDGIAPWILAQCPFFQQTCTTNPDSLLWTTMIVRLAGASIALGASLGAATSGNWDATPISVSLFLVGSVFKLSWPEGEFIGDILFVAAIGMHVYEMWRHKQDRIGLLTGGVLALVIAVICGFFVIAGMKLYPLINPYRILGGYIVATLVAIGASSTVINRRVGAVLPSSFRENIQDQPDSVYFDIKLFVIMLAVAILIF